MLAKAPVEKRLIPVAKAISNGSALVCGIAGLLLLSLLGVKAVYWLFGWRLHDTLSALDQPLLLFALAFGFGWIALKAEAFVERANKPPEQRRLERNERRLRARSEREEQQKKEAARKASGKAWRRAALRGMSGWRRLWIVLSVLFAVPAAILGWDSADSYSDFVEVPRDIGDEEFWPLVMARPALEDCAPGTARAEPASSFGSAARYWVRCDGQDPLTPAILWAFAPALFMAATGLTVRWVYRGFRPRPAPATN